MTDVVMISVEVTSGKCLFGDCGTAALLFVLAGLGGAFRGVQLHHKRRLLGAALIGGGYLTFLGGLYLAWQP